MGESLGSPLIGPRSLSRGLWLGCDPDHSASSACSPKLTQLESEFSSRVLEENRGET